MRAKRSRPISSVPSQCWRDGAAFGVSRYCFAYPAGASQFAANAALTTSNKIALAALRQAFMRQSLFGNPDTAVLTLPVSGGYERLHLPLNWPARLQASPGS